MGKGLLWAVAQSRGSEAGRGVKVGRAWKPEGEGAGGAYAGASTNAGPI